MKGSAARIHRSVTDTDTALKIFKECNGYGKQTRQGWESSPTYFVLFTILFIIATLDFGYSQKVIKAKWIVLIFIFTFSFQCSHKAVTVLAESKKKFHALTSLEKVSTFTHQYSPSHASFTATVSVSSNENF